VFLQETKTKRGGKTYISYLVRESFRTANGPRGRTICNLTHLPKEVRELVAQALRGQALVPLERLEVNNIHSFGGCVVLDDASRRYALPDLLAPLSPRSSSLVRAMIFGGLLNAPSVAPFYVEARTARLAMFCGLDADKEKFDAVDLTAALRELDECWARIAGLFVHARPMESRAVTFFCTSLIGERLEHCAIGLDPEGIPVPLNPGLGAKLEFTGDDFLQTVANQGNGSPPLIAVEEEAATRLHLKRVKNQPWLVALGQASLTDILRQLNQSQLAHAIRTGGPVEVRHQGERYILIAADAPQETQESQMRMGSVKELTSPAPAATRSLAPAPGAFHGVVTNLAAERLSAGAAIEWAARARAARAAFSPVQIVIGRPLEGEGLLTWRNHHNLQFLTHWMRCRLHGEWSAKGESRRVEDILRDLQEVHRATLTVDGTVVRRMASHPSKNVSTLLQQLGLRDLFETTPECGKK
jgi:hypothetical protein